MSHEDRADRLLREVRFQSRSEEDHIDDGQLMAYRAGKTKAETTAAVENHLARCSECRSLLMALAEAGDQAELHWPEPHRPARRWVAEVPVAAVLGICLSLGIPSVVTVTLNGTSYRPPTEGELSLEPLGAVATLRSGGGGPGLPLFTAETRVSALLRAAQPRSTEGETISLFVESPGGELRRVLDAVQRPTKTGGYEISAPATGVFQDDGFYRLHFAVHAERNALENIANLSALRTQARVLSQAVRFRSEP